MTEPVTYTFDDADRLTGVSRPAQAVTIGYDDADRRTSLGLPGGITQTYASDAAGRRAKLTGSLAPTGLPAAVGSASCDAATA